MSFFSTVVPVIMRQENYSLQSIGLLQLVKLPWIFKFLWAPLVDSHSGRPGQLRRWIIFSELFYAAVILSIGFLDLQTDFRLIVILMIIAFIASATQDIAVDIFAIFQLKPDERGFGNSIQSAGSFTGTIFGTGVLLIAYYYFGWDILLVLLSLFVVLAVIPLVFYRNNPPRPVVQAEKISMLEIAGFFRGQGKTGRVLILVFYYSGIIGILTLLKPFLVDLGYNVKEIGFMSGIFGTSVAAISAFAGGFIIKKAGRRLSMYLFPVAGFMAAAWFWFISAGTPGLTHLYIGTGMLWAAYGLSTVAIYTTSMDIVRKGREGTDFTIQIVITHLSSLITAVVSGKLGDMIGYHNFFGFEALMCLFTVMILSLTLKSQKLYENS
jgi:MFS family permease